MKFKYFIFLLVSSALLYMSGCKKSDSKESILKEIKTLFESNDMSDTSVFNKIHLLKEKYAELYNDSIAQNFLMETSFYAIQKKQYDKALSQLKTFIERSDNDEAKGHANIAMAKVYSKQGKHLEAIQAVNSISATHFALNGSSFWDVLSVYDEKIKQAGATAQDYDQMAKMAEGAAQPQIAINCIDSVLNKFPKYEKKPDLLYRAGFAAWDGLKDGKLAEKYYREFLKVAPEHPLAPDAKKILEGNLLNMTDEEILQMFQSKNPS